jgi:hypothetical protein
MIALVAACGDSGSHVDAAVDAPAAIGVIFINEVMASNTSACADPFGEFDDWVELYNASDADIDLGDYTVTDDLAIPSKARVPAGVVIAARGFKLLWFDDQVQGVDHLAFKLGANGEAFGLYAPTGDTVDSVTFGMQTTDVSLARVPDGSGPLATCSTPSCGAANHCGGS